LDPFEFIVGLNGPTEKPLKNYLADQESKGRLKLVWNPANIGVRAFNQVMRLASTPYIFRCDSDIRIQQPRWTRMMLEQWQVSSLEIGDVVAVGTSNTLGHRIIRTKNTTETDMIMSNCMLIVEPVARVLRDRLRSQLTRMESYVESRKEGGYSYPGESADLEAVLEYVRYHAPWWDIHFGGPDESLGYGSDDMLWSLLARWSGLKLVTSNAQVQHRDASARPGYEAERHRLVSRGFQYLRTTLSLVMDCWEQKYWDGLPNNLPILKTYRESGQILRM
jgi:glycosyltransferase involved in cell wall biosynthesis